MLYIENFVKASLSEIFEKLYEIKLPLESIELEHPVDIEWGDYSTNLPLKISKSIKQNPMQVANDICYEINDKIGGGLESSGYSKYFKEVYVASPGFINMRLSDEWLINVLNDEFRAHKYYRITNRTSNNKIALEHSNVNPNKAAHVGHLRNAVIGQYLERIYEHIGYDVNVQYYVNDVGVQVATSSLGIKYIKDINEGDYSKFDHYAWDVYSRITLEIENDPEYKSELDQIMINIEDPNSEDAIRQSNLSDRILKDQLETFSKLDIDYDVIVHERDILYMKLWDKAFESLKTNKNVYFATSGKSKGCWLIKLNDKSGNLIGPQESTESLDIEEDKIIVRSNGVPTYTGKDIAYHMWKFGLLGVDFNYEIYNGAPQDKVLWSTTYKNTDNTTISFSNSDIVHNVIDVKQTYPIEVVKRSLEFLGFSNEASRMVHINYGFVYLSPKTAASLGIDISDKKDRYGMSGRKGWGIKVDDLIDMIDSKIISEHGESATLRDVRIAAIKFEILKYNTFQDIVFDIDTALNIKGYSGPYIQYTYARTASISRKSTIQVNSIDFHAVAKSIPLHPLELGILRVLYKFREVTERSAQEFAPNILCNYLFELCQKYNHFYNEVSILNESEVGKREFRLVLNDRVGQILKIGLYLLGIRAPEKM